MCDLSPRAERGQKGPMSGPFEDWKMNREGCACLLLQAEAEETYGELVKEWARAVKRADPEVTGGFVAAPIFPEQPVFQPRCEQPCSEVLVLPECH